LNYDIEGMLPAVCYLDLMVVVRPGVDETAQATTSDAWLVFFLATKTAEWLCMKSFIWTRGSRKVRGRRF